MCPDNISQHVSHSLADARIVDIISDQAIPPLSSGLELGLISTTDLVGGVHGLLLKHFIRVEVANHKGASQNYAHDRIPDNLSASSTGASRRSNSDEMKRLGLTAAAAHVVCCAISWWVLSGLLLGLRRPREEPSFTRAQCELLLK